MIITLILLIEVNDNFEILRKNYINRFMLNVSVYLLSIDNIKCLPVDLKHRRRILVYLANTRRLYGEVCFLNSIVCSGCPVYVHERSESLTSAPCR